MERRLTLEERKLRRCKHFTGTMNARCKAGVLYADVRLYPQGEGGRYLLPCFSENDSCPCRELPTPEEVAAEIAEGKAHSARCRTIRAEIMKATKGEKRVSGRIKCPCCEVGSVGFSVAFNGHVAATCSTRGCACWME